MRLNVFENDLSVFEYLVLDKERGKMVEELMIEVLELILNYIKKDFDKNWFIVEKKYKMYLFGLFLMEYYLDGVIDMIGVFFDMEVYMGMFLIEVLCEMIFFILIMKYYEIIGGMDKLLNVFLL